MIHDTIRTLIDVAYSTARSAATGYELGEDAIADELLAAAIDLARIADNLADIRGIGNQYPDMPGADDIRSIVGVTA